MKSFSIVLAVIASLIAPANAATAAPPPASPSDPDLPYSCTLVRWAVDRWGPEAVGRWAAARGFTPKQIHQAEVCLRLKGVD
jgi:hypothetical protein